MKEPSQPNKEDCCNSGCNPCIFDVYEKHLLLYKKSKERGDEVETFTENAISLLKYTSFIVVENVELCKDHHLIILKVESNLINNVYWKPGDHFLVKFTSGDSSCSRAYTPLKLKVTSNSEFSVIVKSYSHGVVSQYLCDLNQGQVSLWRGPYGSYEMVPNKYDRIVMIAQGTGIAPFISIIDNILNNDDDMTKLTLLFCCKNTDCILIREELYSWKRYWNFTYTIYLSYSNQDDVFKYQEPIVKNKLDIDNLKSLMPCSAMDQILLCGSIQFMDYYKVFFESEKCENIVLF